MEVEATKLAIVQSPLSVVLEEDRVLPKLVFEIDVSSVASAKAGVVRSGIVPQPIAKPWKMFICLFEFDLLRGKRLLKQTLAQLLGSFI